MNICKKEQFCCALLCFFAFLGPSPAQARARRRRRSRRRRRNLKSGMFDTRKACSAFPVSVTLPHSDFPSLRSHRNSRCCFQSLAFNLLIITRNPSERFRRKLEDVVPFGVPDLFKPSKTSKNRRKPMVFEPICLNWVFNVFGFGTQAQCSKWRQGPARDRGPGRTGTGPATILCLSLGPGPRI